MFVVIFLILHWYLSLFSQTFFLHRYAAHKQFDMSKFWERFFHVFSYISQGSSYLSPYAYGVLHRLHHAFTDTEKDPHSPVFDKNLFSMMWRTRKNYNEIFDDEALVDPKFKVGVPRWRKFEEFASAWYSRVGWGLFYAVLYILFAPSLWMLIFLPIHWLMGPVHGAIINWFAHKIGYTNFDVKDTSKNIMPLDIFMMGEGYHNNHHKYAGRANFGVKWYELDPTYPVIWLLDKVGIISLRPQPHVVFDK